MSDFLRILENEVQIIALSFLGFVYVFRLIWLFKFKFNKERTYPEGDAGKGAWYSLTNVAMPWAMESTRKKPGFYMKLRRL